MKKTINERLASKYKKEKKGFTTFRKVLEITKDEADWIRENPNEFRQTINESEGTNYSVAHYEVFENEVIIDMSI